MNQPTIEEIVRATIEQLSKKPEPPKDDFREWFRARQEKKKLRRILKSTNKV
jgi:hypothetical protein